MSVYLLCMEAKGTGRRGWERYGRDGGSKRTTKATLTGIRRIDSGMVGGIERNKKVFKRVFLWFGDL